MIVYFSDTEKEILMNFFILRGNSSRKNFMAFKNEIEKNILQSTEPLIYMWDKENTLVNYIFEQPKFSPSNTSFHQLKNFNPDWNALNAQGENSLLILARRGSLFKLGDLINTAQPSGDIVTHSGECLASILMSEHFFERKNQLSYENISRFIDRWLFSASIVNQFPAQLDYITIEKLQNLAQRFSEELDKIKNELPLIREISEKAALEQLAEINPLHMLNHVYLQRTLSDNEDKVIRKRKL